MNASLGVIFLHAYTTRYMLMRKWYVLDWVSRIENFVIVLRVKTISVLQLDIWFCRCFHLIKSRFHVWTNCKFLLIYSWIIVKDMIYANSVNIYNNINMWGLCQKIWGSLEFELTMNFTGKKCFSVSQIVNYYWCYFGIWKEMKRKR